MILTSAQGWIERLPSCGPSRALAAASPLGDGRLKWRRTTRRETGKELGEAGEGAGRRTQDARDISGAKET